MDIKQQFAFLMINEDINIISFISDIIYENFQMWNINNCGAVTLGQEKRYMHISVHTLTHIYMRGGMRENIYIYQVIHHQSARDTLSRCLKE
jgi:hypothetical protein